MRALFTLAGLMLVLAVVAVMARHSLKTQASGQRVMLAPSLAASAVLDDKALHPATPQQAQALEKQVQNDVNQLMQNRAADLEQRTDPKP